MNEEPRDTIILEDEEGKKEEFKILLDSLFVKDRQYVVLMPVSQEDEAEPEMVILRVEEDEDGEDILYTIDDDLEWEEVLKELEKMDIEASFEDTETEDDDELDEPK